MGYASSMTQSANHQGDGALHDGSSDAAPAPASPNPPSGPDGGYDAATGNGSPPANSRRSTTTRLSRSNTQNAKGEKGQLRPTASNAPSIGLDPLSNQIYLRTNSHTEQSQSIAQRLLVPGRPESPNPEAAETTNNKPPSAVVDATKEWRKGSSFLSRLSMRTPWTRDDDVPDSDSELGEARDDGANARALTSVLGAGGGYIPFYKEPPRYIKAKTRNKKTREFNRMFLAQELSAVGPDKDDDSTRAPSMAVGKKILKGGSAAIWATEFSCDGRYLAVGGKDDRIRVYAVISTPEDRKAQEEDEVQCGNIGEKLSAPVFRSKPIREFEGHTGEVLSMSWGKNGFLLSASMDKTVKLWHPSRSESLATFKHTDIVTSIAFHPTDDRFFLAGCLDAQLRLWSIPDKDVPYSAEAGEFITAVGFSPDGKTAICGGLSGMCTFYETEGLQAQFQIHVRSSRGKNAKGSKITGIETTSVQSGPSAGDVKVLISSNDSRVRVYSLETRMLEAKYRGHVNQSSQIHARFTEDGRHIICGSEDRKAYIWGPAAVDGGDRDKQPYECFDAHPEVVTTAVVAPTKSRQLLSASGDPIYDLCNPPPVTLVSLAESQASDGDGEGSQRLRHDSNARKPEETPAYVERSKHHDGNIIITTDRTGTIKVFRQDCAYVKRQQNMWETGSRFSGKLGGGVGRSASIRTKASGTSRVQSRRGSVSLANSPVLPQPTSDRIISWRQDVDGTRLRSRNVTPARSERSLSPNKASRTSLVTAGTQETSRGSMLRSPPGSPTSSTHTTRTTGRLGKTYLSDATIPPTPSFSFMSAADSRKPEGDGSFWNRWRPANKASSGSLAPGSPIDMPGRRSMGVSETARLSVMEDKQSRRLSSAARLPSGSSKLGASETMEESPPPTPAAVSVANPRVDSGIGRLSGESVAGKKA